MSIIQAPRKPVEILYADEFTRTLILRRSRRYIGNKLLVTEHAQVQRCIDGEWLDGGDCFGWSLYSLSADGERTLIDEALDFGDWDSAIEAGMRCL